MPDRSKRHHYVPQLLLRGFSADGRLVTFDRVEGRSYVQPVLTAAAENNYNTITDANGGPSDVVESAIADLEEQAAAALRKLSRGEWLHEPAELASVASFVAFQFIRVPRQRQFEEAVANSLMKLQVAASGPEGIRAALEEQGRPASDDDVREIWEQIKDFDSWNVELSADHHLATSFLSLRKCPPYWRTDSTGQFNGGTAGAS